MALLAGFFLLHFLVGEFVGYPCPACSRWALRRLARHRHYYRCSACGARLKRYGLGPWLDATGPQDAARYRKPTDAGTWKGYEPPGRLDDSTSGHLLENQEVAGRCRPGDLACTLDGIGPAHRGRRAEGPGGPREAARRSGDESSTRRPTTDPGLTMMFGRTVRRAGLAPCAAPSPARGCPRPER